MKLKFFILILSTLVCGILIGYYIGKPKTTKQSEEINGTENRDTNAPVYGGPFGLDMGLSLDDVKKVCKIEHIENDAYKVTPPKANGLFKTYIVWIDPEYGIHGIRAISENITTNDNGTELKLRFEDIVESVGNKYGKYKRTDNNSNGIFSKPQYFMYTLREGSRELSAVWAKKYQSQLPDYIFGIRVDAVADKSLLNGGSYVIMEYSFSNSDAVDAKADSVF